MALNQQQKPEELLHTHIPDMQGHYSELVTVCHMLDVSIA